MYLARIELHNFRNCLDLMFEPGAQGVFAIMGKNGQGKTSLLEAIAYLSTRTSFRGASKETVISYGAEEAVIRGNFVTSSGREILVETSLSRSSRDRFALNKNVQKKAASVKRTVPVTVFTTQDIEVVRGGPALRREFLDGGVEMTNPRGETTISAVEKILRQRATLLRQAGGAVTREVSDTLDVWDHQLSQYGTKLAEMREGLIAMILPYARDAYCAISGSGDDLSLRYQRSWDGDLADSLAVGRQEDLRRQANGTGPHRDEMEINLNGRPLRHNGSQGEQRTAAYALRVALHSLYKDLEGEDPILLLDDVFSELDSSRSEAILASISAAQTILTTAGEIPGSIAPTKKIFISHGVLDDSL